MQNFNIRPLSDELSGKLSEKINGKTKPPGSLGRLEELAFLLGRIQNNLTVELKNPTIMVFAGDHGITAEAVSPYPQEVTGQMVLNFLSGGAAINVFAARQGMDLIVVDAGVNFTFETPLPAPPPIKSSEASIKFVQAKIDFGTANFLVEDAMSRSQLDACLDRGVALVQEISEADCNVIGFGEMGIGNTSSAALIFSLISGYPISDCAGRGAGLDDTGLSKKFEVLDKARARILKDFAGEKEISPEDILKSCGGFEIAMMCGAMLAAAERGMTLLIDGFICTAALLIASKTHPDILDYCVFSHCSDEKGHRLMLDFLKANPLLDLQLRLGEGAGGALAFPLLQNAADFLNYMASFESAGVSNREEAEA